MNRRVCHTSDDVASWCSHLARQSLPITVQCKAGADRTLSQNNLARQWSRDISRALGDLTPDQAHAFNKLTFGVPLLMEEEAFAVYYDKFIGPHPYEDRLKSMEGDRINITSAMSVPQMREFMDAVWDYWTQRGVVLTLPPPM